MSEFDHQNIAPSSRPIDKTIQESSQTLPSNNIQTSSGSPLEEYEYSPGINHKDRNSQEGYEASNFTDLNNNITHEPQIEQEPDRFQDQSYEVQRTQQRQNTQSIQLQKTIRLCNVKLLVPPLNFALVAEDVYRSGHPLEINHPFIENLNLRTIVYIGDPPSSKDKGKDINSVKIFQRYQEWAKEQNIRLVHFHQPSAKEPFRENNKDIIKEALEIILDTRNLPVLLNSNKGKHRIGVLIGVMRVLLQGWSLATTFDEYIKFANGKSDADLEFIERFKEVIEYDSDYAPQWLRKA